MSQSTEARNEAIVLEAFDTLFNKRDYGAAERFWSPNYVQHSAHIEPGRDGLFNLIKSMPPQFKHEHEQVVSDGLLFWVGDTARRGAEFTATHRQTETVPDFHA